MYKSIEIMKNYTDADELKDTILKRYNIKKDFNNVLIFGAGRLGKYVLKAFKKEKINVLGFIDNSENVQGKNIEGLKIYSLSEAKRFHDSLIIICSLNYMGEIYEELKREKVNNYIPYQVLCIIDSMTYGGFNESVDGVIEDIISNKDKYIKLFDYIKEETSLKILDSILLYRLTFDIEYLINAYNLSSGELEYFDKKIVKLGDAEVFVDGGAYKGETTKDFIRCVKGKYKKIYLFEPDSELVNICKKNLSSYTDIEYLEYGISNTSKSIKFNKTNDTGGRINKDGNCVINLNYIDNIVKDEVSFIKLDIEGAESDALSGAFNTIRKYRPKMAISAYHKAQDLWNLFYKVKDINDEYKVYIRHYSKGIFETDFYFIED